MDIATFAADALMEHEIADRLRDLVLKHEAAGKVDFDDFAVFIRDRKAREAECAEALDALAPLLPRQNLTLAATVAGRDYTLSVRNADCPRRAVVRRVTKLSDAIWMRRLEDELRRPATRDAGDDEAGTVDAAGIACVGLVS